MTCLVCLQRAGLGPPAASLSCLCKKVSKEHSPCCPRPAGWTAVSSIGGLSVTAGGRELATRLLGFAVEQDGGAYRLHVLVDLPSTGFQDGPFRMEGAQVAFTANGKS